MRLILAMAIMVGGYTLLYYGVVLYRTYDSSSGTSTGIPLSILLGFSGATNAASPPFHYGGSVS